MLNRTEQNAKIFQKISQGKNTHPVKFFKFATPPLFCFAKGGDINQIFLFQVRGVPEFSDFYRLFSPAQAVGSSFIPEEELCLETF